MYPGPSKQEFAALTALLHPSRVFLNAAVEARRGPERGGTQHSPGGAIAVWFVDIVGINASAALEVKQSRH